MGAAFPEKPLRLRMGSCHEFACVASSVHGGFVHAGFAAFENRLTICKGPDGPAFTINALAGKQGQTDVRLDINVGSEHSPCAQPNRMRQRMMHRHLQNLIPPLG